MKPHLPIRIRPAKSKFRYSPKAAISVLLLFGILFRSPGPLAAESQGNGDPVRETPGSPIVPQAVMYLPLSTWVGPGDIIRIKAFPDTALFITGDYPILENGFAMLPVLGMVQVTSVSISALTGNLTAKYAKYLAYPTIQVEPIIRLSFLGGFINPGMHKVNPMCSFSNALSAAQGTVRDDGLRLLRWERGGKVLSTDLTAEVEGTKSLYALGFKSGDQVCVTILTQRDRLPVISLIVSTILAAGTLAITLWVISK